MRGRSCIPNRTTEMPELTPQEMAGKLLIDGFAPSGTFVVRG